MKEILGKVNQHNKSKLPRKLFFDKKIYYFRDRNSQKVQ